MRLLIIGFLGCVATADTLRAESAVVLRGAAEPLGAPVTQLSDAGVHVGGDQVRIIGWDSVKAVTGDLSVEAETYRALADDAWRARLRLSRGDLERAEPLFEVVYERVQATPGPTALMAAEGLMRCRLRRGDQFGAIEPWLTAVRLRDAGFRIAGDPPILPVLDTQLNLSAALPPIWIDDAATSAAISTGLEVEPDPSRANELHALYMDAARFEVSNEPIDLDSTSGDPTVDFVRMIVAARVGDATQRARARETLVAGLGADPGTWKEAWRRVAIGRSCLMEDDPSLRTEGLLHLLHLPARFGVTHPYLNGIALAEASLELRRTGDDVAADALQRELQRNDPYHPALLWLDRERRALARSPEAASQDQ